MAVDLFALRANLELTGQPQMLSGLQSINTTGRQTAASLRGVSNGALEITRNIMAQEAATRAVTARSTALSGALTRISRDIGAATLDFKAGRISATDHAAAMGFARSEATKLGSAASMTGQQLKSYSGILSATATQSMSAAKSTGFLKDMMSSGMVQFFGVTAAMAMVRSGFSTAFAAADRFTNSQTMLAGIAKITGVPLADLQRVSQGVARDFKLTTVQANELTAGMNKLTQMAGQPEKMRASVEALLDIGSARGLSTVQVMSAINNALAGNDEGTDKLFMKNPSEIYRKWAAAAGVSAANLTATQRAQALLDALLTDGGKVRGKYLEWLLTLPGLNQQVETATEKLAIAFGRLFNPMRSWVASHGASVLNWAADVLDRFRNLGGLKLSLADGILGNLAKNGGMLFAAGLGAGKDGWAEPGGFRGNLGPHPGLAALGPLAASNGLTKERIELLGRGHELGILTRKEEQERLRAIRQVNAELHKTVDLETRIALIKELADLGVKSETPEARQHRLLKLLDRKPEKGLVPPSSPNLQVRPGLAGTGVGPRALISVVDQELDQLHKAVEGDFRHAGQSLGQALAGGLADGLNSAFHNGKPLRALGRGVLSGLGDIMSRMGKSLLAYGAAMTHLLPALSNPFTSGPAALVAGALLLGLGTALGGIASGSGTSAGSSASKDQVTRITLTAPGAGGKMAPEARTPIHVTVIGPSDLGAQRALHDLMVNGTRRGFSYGG